MKNIVNGHLTGFGDVQDFEESPSGKAEYENYLKDFEHQRFEERKARWSAAARRKGKKLVIKTTWRTH